MVAVIEFAEITVKLVAATPPKAIPVAPVKSVLAMATEVVPEVGPVEALMPVTVGAGA